MRPIVRVEPYNTRARGTSRRTTFRTIEEEARPRRPIEEPCKRDDLPKKKPCNHDDLPKKKPSKRDVLPKKEPCKRDVLPKKEPCLRTGRKKKFPPSHRSLTSISLTSSPTRTPRRYDSSGIARRTKASARGNRRRIVPIGKRGGVGEREFEEFEAQEYDMPDDEIEDEEDNDEAVQNRRPCYRIRNGRRIPSPPRMCYNDMDDFPEMITEALLRIVRSHDYHEDRERRVIAFYRDMLFTWMPVHRPEMAGVPHLRRRTVTTTRRGKRRCLPVR